MVRVVTAVLYGSTPKWQIWGWAGDAFWLVFGLKAAIGVQHTGGKSGGELVTLFGGYSYDGLNAAIGVQHTGGKYGGELVTLFGSYSYDGLNAAYYADFLYVGNGACILDGIFRML